MSRGRIARYAEKLEEKINCAMYPFLSYVALTPFYIIYLATGLLLFIILIFTPSILQDRFLYSCIYLLLGIQYHNFVVFWRGVQHWDYTRIATIVIQPRKSVNPSCIAADNRSAC